MPRSRPNPSFTPFSRVNPFHVRPVVKNGPTPSPFDLPSWSPPNPSFTPFGSVNPFPSVVKTGTTVESDERSVEWCRCHGNNKEGGVVLGDFNVKKNNSVDGTTKSITISLAHNPQIKRKINNILAAPSFTDGELPKDDRLAKYSFMFGGHRITVEVECPELHVESCLPKLTKEDYYTEPTIQQLASREKDNHGYCSRVKDFVVGRHGYGSITFPGETDVRGLDLDAIVQFSSKEVVVYADKEKQPPIGEGLNKAGVVTLLNVKYYDEKGEQYTDGAAAEKIKDLLKKTSYAFGGEFISYDAVRGIWKFAVKHFALSLS